MVLFGFLMIVFNCCVLDVFGCLLRRLWVWVLLARFGFVVLMWWFSCMIVFVLCGYLCMFWLVVRFAYLFDSVGLVWLITLFGYCCFVVLFVVCRHMVCCLLLSFVACLYLVWWFVVGWSGGYVAGDWLLIFRVFVVDAFIDCGGRFCSGSVF